MHSFHSLHSISPPRKSPPCGEKGSDFASGDGFGGEFEDFDPIVFGGEGDQSGVLDEGRYYFIIVWIEGFTAEDVVAVDIEDIGFAGCGEAGKEGREKVAFQNRFGLRAEEFGLVQNNFA